VLVWFNLILTSPDGLVKSHCARDQSHYFFDKRGLIGCFISG
jgi:hypothetical protein